MVGEKEAVTKEWENEDRCVGEREKDRKENMVMERNSHVSVSANSLKEFCVCAFLFWGICLYACAGAGLVFKHMNAHLPVWFGTC